MTAVPRWARLAGAVVLTLVLLAAAVWLHGRLRMPLQRQAPLAVRGTVNDQLQTRNLRFTVTRARLVKPLTLKTPRATSRLETPGVFVLVEVNAMALSEPTSLAAIVLTTADGHRYQPSDRLRDATSARLDPLLTTRTRYLFEIPAGSQAGARLSTSAGQGALLRAGVDVDLELGAADRPRPVTVRSPR
ncbi:MAG: hypothetical protein GEV11_08455 [Streptosporangiales bacterium]|nr:hypothetical protein [Streptosporangiales bacterium]